MQALVTDTHYRMTAALVRDLRDAGASVVAVTSEGKQSIGGYVRGVAERVTLPVDDDGEGLLSLCRRFPGSVLFPVGGETLRRVSARRDEFMTVTRVLAPFSDVLESANQKPRVAALCRTLGLPVPEEYVCAPGESVTQMAARLDYPVVVKLPFGERLGIPAAGRYDVVRSPAAFVARYEAMDALQSPPVVQTYHGGDGWGVSVLCDAESRPVSIIGHRRLREYPLSGGPSTFCEAVWPERMVAAAVRLLGALGFVGPAMVEFKGSPEDFVVLEINPRIWGTFPLTRIARSDFTARWLRLLLGERLDEVGEPHYRVGQRMQFLAGDARVALARLRAGQIGQAAAVAGAVLSPGVRGGVWSWHDPRPGWQYFTTLVGRGRHET